jgi:hypothetical protein
VVSLKPILRFSWFYTFSSRQSHKTYHPQCSQAGISVFEVDVSAGTLRRFRYSSFAILRLQGLPRDEGCGVVELTISPCGTQKETLTI